MQRSSVPAIERRQRQSVSQGSAIAAVVLCGAARVNRRANQSGTRRGLQARASRRTQAAHDGEQDPGGAAASRRRHAPARRCRKSRRLHPHFISVATGFGATMRSASYDDLVLKIPGLKQLLHICSRCHAYGLKLGILSTSHGDYGWREAARKDPELGFDYLGLCDRCSAEIPNNPRLS